MIESLEEMREWARDLFATPFGGDALDLVDGVEREIAENFMQLPKDSNGVPIRPGDRLVNVNDGEPYHVMCVSHDTMVDFRLLARQRTRDYRHNDA